MVLSAALFLGALVTTSLATPLMIRAAMRLDVVDRPGFLKPHSKPVPYLGGLAVAFGGFLAMPWALATGWPILPLVLAATLGLVDDIRGLPARVRLVGQLLVGVLVWWTALGGTSLMVLVVAVALTVLLTNAMNLIDGLDGLASGVATVSLFVTFLVVPGSWGSSALAWAGATAGFLLYNRSPARIFLGDAGSYLLGAVVALHGLAAVFDAPGLGLTGLTGAAVVLAVAAYPVVELVSTVARRLRRRKPLTSGDREHVYDRWVDRGHSPTRVTAVIVTMHASLAATAVLVAQSGSNGLAWGVVLLIAGFAAACIFQPSSSGVE